MAVTEWRQDVKASLLFYRIAAVFLLLFAVGHTLGFRQSDPAWGIDTLLGSMRSIRFDIQGFNRTYWDLFVAAGFSAVWALALSFAAITVVSWTYLFIIPIVFSILIPVCLTAAAWLSAKPSRAA